MILTKEYRLVWDSEIVLYGQFDLDTQTELDNKVTSLGFEIPEEVEIPE